MKFLRPVGLEQSEQGRDMEEVGEAGGTLWMPARPS